MSPRHWRNARPWQRVHQRCRTNVRGISSVVSICTRRLSHTSLEYAALASLFTRGGADPSTFAACRRGCAAWHEPRRHKTLEDDRDVHMQRRRALLISDSGALFGSMARHFVAVSQLSCLVSVWTAPFLCQFSNNSALNEARTNPIGCAPPGARACGGTPAASPRHRRNAQPKQHTHGGAAPLDVRRHARARARARGGAPDLRTTRWSGIHKRGNVFARGVT